MRHRGLHQITRFIPLAVGAIILEGELKAGWALEALQRTIAGPASRSVSVVESTKVYYNSAPDDLCATVQNISGDSVTLLLFDKNGIGWNQSAIPPGSGAAVCTKNAVKLEVACAVPPCNYEWRVDRRK